MAPSDSHQIAGNGPTHHNMTISLPVGIFSVGVLSCRVALLDALRIFHRIAGLAARLYPMPWRISILRCSPPGGPCLARARGVMHTATAGVHSNALHSAGRVMHSCIPTPLHFLFSDAFFLMSTAT